MIVESCSLDWVRAEVYSRALKEKGGGGYGDGDGDVKEDKEDEAGKMEMRRDGETLTSRRGGSGGGRCVIVIA